MLLNGLGLPTGAPLRLAASFGLDVGRLDKSVVGESLLDLEGLQRRHRLRERLSMIAFDVFAGAERPNPDTAEKPE
jgi:hypothetical protein